MDASASDEFPYDNESAVLYEQDEEMMAEGDQFSSMDMHDSKHNQVSAIQRINHAMLEESKAIMLNGLELQDIRFLQHFEWNQLEEVHLDRNRIQSIDILCNYPNLKTLDASNNYIRSVNLTNKMLHSVNLSNNFIEYFPGLASARGLRDLNVSQNKLKGLAYFSAQSNPRIRRLVLSHNQIRFDD